MKSDPITKKNPTVLDLAKQGNQMHECLEQAHAKIDNVTVVVDEIKAALAPKGRSASGLSTPFRAWFRTVGATATSIGGFIILYKVVLVLAPVALGALIAIDHAIRTGGL